MKRSSRQNWLVIHLVCLALLGGLVVGLHADGGSQHQTKKTRPIPLGVSGGSNQDFDFPFCCGGTLGALVTKGGIQYILSNNHVIARSGRGTVGEPIVQPGLIDVGCNQSLEPENRVARLSELVPISFNSNNEVDAAIAEVDSGKVADNGEILDIGTISASTIDPALGMTVQKSGRTTGHTTGSVSQVGVTVSVRYPNKCGSGGGSTATFVNQFAVTDGTFSSGGDSGSLILENTSAVGLLFAGSSSHTIGNPIAAVRCALGVDMVGQGSSNNLDCSAGGDGGDGGGGGGGDDPPPPAGNTASVGCVTYSTSGGPQSNRHLRITISIVDENGNPVSGASVSANITRDGSAFAAPTATTNSSGEVSFQFNNAPNGTYVTTVTNITASGMNSDTTTPENSFTKGGATSALFCNEGASPGSLTRRGPPPEKTRRAIAVKQKYERLLFALSNAVVGVGVGAEGAEPAIDLFLESAASIPGLPAQLENVKVRTIVTGPFVAGGWREPSDLTGAVAACEQ